MHYRFGPHLLFACAVGLLSMCPGTLALPSQTAPVQGLHDNSPRVHALVNARIVTGPGKTIENGTLVLRNGLVSSVGNQTPPPDARVWNLEGRTIYPGFIDSYSTLDLPKELQPLAPKPTESEAPRATPAADKKPRPGAGSWNGRVTPERNARDYLVVDGKQTEKWRSLGFTSALVVPARGIFRGTSTLVNLSGDEPNRSVVRPLVAQHIAFEQSGFREATYPGSLMGTIALIRQTFLDADWNAKAQTADKKQLATNRPEANAALDALGTSLTGQTAVVFETEDELDLLRAARIAGEFKLNAWLLGNGHEYRMLPELVASRLPVILPLNFPAVPEIETPEKALDVSLESLQHWNDAPSNPVWLARAGVPFALSTTGLKKPEEIWINLRKAVRGGLSKDAALAALTTTPARLFGVADRYGTLEPGKVANLVVADGDLFASRANILTVWVDGQYYETDKAREVDPRGTWTVTWSGANAGTTLEISGEVGKLKAALGPAKDIGASIREDQLVLLAPAASFGRTGTVRLAADVQVDTLRGSGQLPDGQVFTWSARRTARFTSPSEPTEQATPTGEVPGTYPAGAFGMQERPAQPEVVLVRGATIWTSGPAGRLDQDLLVEKGKIVRTGKNLAVPAGATVIDGRGKHLTPGLIDAHSHTAISRGINEGTHAITAEVRIGDVLDATDINIYRELAGGLTTANILHGSANPIGGQNQVIKLRWGETPEGLKFAGAKPGIKFALGENVKQANWGEQFTTRYPQTRMGVEQLIRDNFMAARDYEQSWKRFNSGATTLRPRRDLQMESVLEILRGERLVHIHAYRQDEILMFARLAKQTGISVGSFQHVLEGFKVADAIAEIGAGGSSFSDWWGYKFEVYDAIPQNGALMNQAGVVVSFNSDSNELARRLNTEAAKAVKYGGVSEEEALKFVTLNPARQLRIDRRVGSLEAGKDADFVLWSGHPLSTYSHAEQTWIDGRKYFDQARDLQMRDANERERETLIQKALVERQKVLSAPPTEDKRDAPKPADAGATYRALEYLSIYHDGKDHHNCSSAQHDHDL